MHKINRLKQFLLFVFVCTLLSCNTINVYEKTNVFEKHQWPVAQVPSFTFDITDTGALYNIFLVIRHHDAYNYSNIWLNVGVKGPSDSTHVQREFILANNQQGWLGTGMDDIFEHRILFNDRPAPLQKGPYTFTLRQVMREDPLQHILNVGIRVEKVEAP